MRKILITFAVVFVAYFAWKFIVVGAPIVFMTKGGEKNLAAQIKEVKPNSEVILEIDNNSDANTINEISLPRNLASSLRISPPSGFTEEALSISKGEENNKETVDFVTKFNKETLRWVGKHQLTPNTKNTLIFPVKNTSVMDGKISFQYSVKQMIGCKISFFDVNLSGKDKAK